MEVSRTQGLGNAREANEVPPRAVRDGLRLIPHENENSADVDARVTLLLGAAKAGEWDLDLASGRLGASPGLDRLLDMPISGAAVGMFLDRLPIDQAAALRAYFADPGERAWDDDVAFRRRDGAVQFLSLRLRPLRDASGRLQRVIGVVLDVTDRRHAEDALAATLAEKEQLLAEKDVLIREVHHRVKNNLQMVTSLLSLQSRGIVDPTARLLFAEALRRVAVITRIHQRLYQDTELAHVDLARHVTELVNDVRAAAGWDDVSFDLELQSFDVSLDVAVPLTLIANELLLNAMKYAYGGAKGWVGVRLYCIEASGCLLEVVDHGHGLPVKYRPGLGLRLVRALARQMGGDLQVESSRGGARMRVHWSPTAPGFPIAVSDARERG